VNQQDAVRALRGAWRAWLGQVVRVRVTAVGRPPTVRTGRVVQVARGGVAIRDACGYTRFWSWADWLTGQVTPLEAPLATAVARARQSAPAPDPAAVLRALAVDTSMEATLRALRIGAGF
jgi:hypothetical protein